MIDLITSENRELFSEQLEEMWRQRYEVFVEQLGWDLPCQGRREIDQFDRDDTAYLIVNDNDGSTIGSQRMIPTTGPCLLSDVFSELCDGELPRGDDIWEVSRTYMLPRKGGEKSGSRVAAELICGGIEFALLYDVRQLVFELNIELLPQFLSVHWDVMPLGLPRDMDGETLVAQAVNITSTTLSNLRSQFEIEGQLLRYKTRATAA